ncbi:MAG: hypothetical protein KGS61_09410, partial [Verrucomicrobia bacterium]|nr:hypothetical protein [Verrucomicrobiota bacterium]
MDTLLPSVLGLLIPIIAIVLGIGTGIISIILDYSKRKRLMDLYHQQRMAAIDKGIELPPMPLELLTADVRGRKRSRPLLKGLVLLLVGLTVGIALYANHGWRIACYGLIPAGIGVAFLVYHAVEGKKVAAEEQREAESVATKPPATV